MDRFRSAERARIAVLTAAMAILTLASCSVGATGPFSTESFSTESSSAPTVTLPPGPSVRSYPTAPATSHAASAPPSASATTAPSPSPSLPPADLVGRLQGVTSLDACERLAWLTDDHGAEWKVAWPRGYEIRFEGEAPVLVSPEGLVVAEAGALIGVDGTIQSNVGSFCISATGFAASRVVFIDPPVIPARTPRPTTPTPPPPTPTPSPQHPPADLIGEFAGDSQGPCSLIVVLDAEGYGDVWKMRWPDGYRTKFDSIASQIHLVDPTGSTIATTGDLIGVDGAPVADGGITTAAAWGCDFPVFAATRVVFVIPVS